MKAKTIRAKIHFSSTVFRRATEKLTSQNRKSSNKRLQAYMQYSPKHLQPVSSWNLLISSSCSWIDAFEPIIYLFIYNIIAAQRQQGQLTCDLNCRYAKEPQVFSQRWRAAWTCLPLKPAVYHWRIQGGGAIRPCPLSSHMLGQYGHIPLWSNIELDRNI